MDNNSTNPYQLWQSMGSPDFPTEEQFRQLRLLEACYSALVIGQVTMCEPLPTQSFDNASKSVCAYCIVDYKDPVMEGPLPFPDEGSLTLKANLPVPSVLLIHVCAKPSAVPSQVCLISKVCTLLSLILLPNTAIF